MSLRAKRNRKGSKEMTKEEQRTKVLQQNTSFHIKEAYKATRTNIMFSLPGTGCKKIVVTSSYPGEGKSTNCINLALTFAQTGAKVLILDCDLRKPAVHTRLDIGNDKGIAHAISGLCKTEEVIQRNVQENLDVITAGHIPPNPAELLSSEEMDKLLEELGQVYDYIFIDTPPLNIVTDATILSSKTSGAIVVVRQDQTYHNDLREALDKLTFVQAKVLGLLLHDVKGDKSKKYSKYSHNKGYSYGLQITATN